MATRDQMIAEALKEVKDGLIDLGKKLDNRSEANSKEISDLRERVTKVETRIAIVFGILASIGIAFVGALIKYIVK